MYLHCKHGFVEADRWDGARIPDREQQEAVQRCERDGDAVVVARSRELETLLALLADVGITATLFETPDWDYPFRVYVTAKDWACVLAGVALDLDYRNFKHWTSSHRPEQHELAAALWRAAINANPRR